MPDDSDSKGRRTLIGDWPDKYGPYGFGVASLLAIWFTVVKPEMDRNALKFDELREIVAQQRAIAEQLHDVVRDQQEVGRILTKASEILNKSQVANRGDGNN